MRAHLPLRSMLLAAFAAAVAASSMAPNATSASSSTVVGATVPSATNIDVSGCPPTTAGITDFGTVLPGASTVTSLACDVEFGSSNDTARLRVAQQDGSGVAMWSMLGTLDLTYGGGDGIGDRLDDWSYKAQGLIVAPDGSSYVLGEDSDVATIWKFTGTGALDTSWGGGDGISEQVVGVTELWDGVLLDDGSILASGSRNGEEDAVVVKFDPDGDLDTSWGGGDGQSDVVVDGGICWDLWAPCGIHLLPDGKILFTALRDVAGRGMVAIRYEADGDIDLSYGGGDGITERVGPALGVTGPTMHDSILLDDGSVILVGSGTQAGNAVMFLGKFDAEGAPVLGWGGAGTGTRTIALPAGAEGGNAVGVSDGGIVIASTDWSTNWLVKVDEDGLVDNGFGASGFAEFSPGIGTIIVDVEELPDGRIVAMGTDWDTDWIDWSIWVFEPDGAPDVTYGGGDGKSELVDPSSTAPGADSRMSAGELLPDGKVLLSGDGWAGGYVGTARYDAVPVADYDDGVSDWDTAAPNAATFGACLHSVAAGAVESWLATGSCTAADTDPWNPIPASTGAAGASVATAPTGDADAVASLRFGFRAAPDQPAGRYIAPITFEVVAPSEVEGSMVV